LKKDAERNNGICPEANLPRGGKCSGGRCRLKETCIDLSAFKISGNKLPGSRCFADLPGAAEENHFFFEVFYDVFYKISRFNSHKYIVWLYKIMSIFL